MKGSGEYIEEAATDTQQRVVLELGRLGMGLTTLHHKK
jgi:hypothetical protein